MMAVEVIVVGSLHFDVIVTAPRLPWPGETLAGTDMALACGGKGGNQAVAAAQHGVRVAMVGCVGRDDFGRRLRRHLQDAGVETQLLRIVEAASGASVAIADPGGEYRAIIVSGANRHLGEADIAAAGPVIEGARVLLLQNEVPEMANLSAARRAAASGVKVMLNAAPARPLPEDLLAAIDVLVVNAIEAEMLGAGAVATLAQAARAARALAGRVKAAVVTAGGAGVAVQTGEEGFTLSPHPVAVAGTHGAGDTFAGALAARLARGDSLAAAARYANAAAALAVATPAPDRARLRPEDVARLIGTAD
jgi:ribokinase